MACSFDSHRDSVKVGTVVLPPLEKKKVRHREGACRADSQLGSTELEEEPWAPCSDPGQCVAYAPQWYKQCVIAFADGAEEGLTPGEVTDVFAEQVNCEWTLKTQWLWVGHSRWRTQVVGATAVGMCKVCLESGAWGPRGCWEVRLKSLEFTGLWIVG